MMGGMGGQMPMQMGMGGPMPMMGGMQPGMGGAPVHLPLHTAPHFAISRLCHRGQTVIYGSTYAAAAVASARDDADGRPCANGRANADGRADADGRANGRPHADGRADGNAARYDAAYDGRAEARRRRACPRRWRPVPVLIESCGQLPSAGEGPQSCRRDAFWLFWCRQASRPSFWFLLLPLTGWLLLLRSVPLPLLLLILSPRSAA